MPLLFSYGSLQQPEVQMATFGRSLNSTRDELVGWFLSRAPIRDPQRAEALGKTHHANVMLTNDPNDRVAGTVLEITEAEMRLADEYERQDAYVRVAATLQSGRETWVYVYDDGSVHDRVVSRPAK